MNMMHNIYTKILNTHTSSNFNNNKINNLINTLYNNRKLEKSNRVYPIKGRSNNEKIYKK